LTIENTFARNLRLIKVQRPDDSYVVQETQIQDLSEADKRLIAMLEAAHNRSKRVATGAGDVSLDTAIIHPRR
jgi:hypothetical protein